MYSFSTTTLETVLDELLDGISAIDKANKDYFWETPICYDYLVEDTGVIYEIAMPGFIKDEVEIDTKIEGKSFIFVKAEKSKTDKKITSTLPIRKKFDFKLTFDSSKYDVEKTTATMKDGILYLSVPKREEGIPKRVKIQVG
jgi:HSP20 family molecular chaperone IbpA